MADVTLILPQTQVLNVGAGGQQAQNATQSGVPTPVSVSPGALLTGVITGNDAHGSYFLKTDQGTVTLRSTVPLTYNSDVTVRVDTTSGNNANARIISVNGEAYSTYSSPTSQESDTLSPSLLARTQPAVSTQTESQSIAPKPVAIQAVTVQPPQTTPQTESPVAPPTVATPAAPTASAQTSTQPLPVATPQQLPQQLPGPAGVPVVIYAPEPQAATTPGAPATAQTAPAPQSAQVTTQTQPNATPASFTQTPDVIPPNISRLIVAQPQALAQTTAGNILAALLPTPAPTLPPAVVQNNQYAVYNKSNAGISTNVPATATLPPQLPAYVVNKNTDGTVTLQTPQGAVTVKPETIGISPQLLSVGNPVTLALPPAFAPTASATQSVLQDSFTATLKQIFSFASTSSPAAANDLMKRLPSIGPDFVSSAVSFTTSLLRGNMRRILGDAVIAKLTEAGSGELIEKASSQAARTSQLFTQEGEQQQPSTNWTSLSLPYVYQGAIQEARIYVKRDQHKKQENQSKKTTADTRFVVEVSFSDLGDMQLDGLVLPRESSTIFDLIVRTQVPFTPEERTDIINIYSEAAEMTGYKGSINFFVGKDFPVKPLSEMLASATSDIIA